MSELALYTRPGCHLCDQALELCRECGVEPRAVDISGDLGLIERYGTRIPVLRYESGTREIGWPFDAEQLRDFLDHGESGGR